MSVPQISVFVQNEPGHLYRVLEAFDSANINVRGFSASDTGDYGVVRFIVDDADAAIELLKGIGSAAAKTEILCVHLRDEPGELARVLGVFARCGINVSYTYSLISTFIAMCVPNISEAEKLLANEPIELASLEDIANALSTTANKEA